MIEDVDSTNNKLKNTQKKLEKLMENQSGAPTTSTQQPVPRSLAHPHARIAATAATTTAHRGLRAGPARGREPVDVYGLRVDLRLRHADHAGLLHVTDP